MSLATRCIACGTVFRVVQDQLRVSSGWVRCGRCGEVFNAIESLVDLDVERPESAPPASVHGSRVMEDLSRVSGRGALGPRTVEASDGAEDEADGLGSHATAVAAEPSDVAADSPTPTAVDFGERSVAAEADGAPRPPMAGQARVENDAAGNESLAAFRAPGFVRQADRAARWRRPWVRAVLMLFVLASTVLLVWQIHMSHHDWLAARWPMLRPWVAQLCAWSGCRIQSPRDIDALVVESSGLVRESMSDGYRLAVSLRNRSAWPVRLPALDLVVTDATGQVLARRVLRGGDLHEPTESVAPGAELTLSGVLRLRGAQVTGYTIELFYP
jgi:predicted Zn finger-like uncharacterized protein